MEDENYRHISEIISDLKRDLGEAGKDLRNARERLSALESHVMQALQANTRQMEEFSNRIGRLSKGLAFVTHIQWLVVIAILVNAVVIYFKKG